MTRPLGVILAGGLATRMGGGDKGRLPLGDGTLLTHVTARLAPQVDAMALNANGDPARFADTGLPVLADSIDGYAGPLAGVLAGLDWAAEQGATHVVSAAADTPFFPRDLVERLLIAAQRDGTGIALAATLDPQRGAMRQPTFGLWPVALRDDLRAALESGLRKVVLWTDTHNAATASFLPAPHDPFFNVNTPDDLAQAEQLLETAP
ncbi:molybdenum cofactor guanylyltransferase [Aliiroseovarius halocynthiae]|uniref:Molybdenum cofactor guanylyltransferase n=1 Tax=Aliiroseovarius halocynthiae TaxID=985055 RepID=A0A545SN54_9RHOB|nr:molybdenum cofactor guanylyltransferase MobA [Aliiroseovarius halocynthiae]TQV66391.1 molybdenum cofactor guanylyltransferase MobA [Aliiroseovarius halocynthiae]SMR83368.1 molybdenum cofactor guanylyltransferase [Aliiroseovarius halocynthiae]